MRRYKTLKELVAAMSEDANERIRSVTKETPWVEMERQYTAARALHEWADEITKFMYGDLAEALTETEKMQHAESPTGVVHAVEGDIRDLGDINRSWVFTSCHACVDGAYEHAWPLTDKPVTCRNCLTMISRKMNSGTDEV